MLSPLITELSIDVNRIPHYDSPVLKSSIVIHIGTRTRGHGELKVGRGKKHQLILDAWFVIPRNVFPPNRTGRRTCASASNYPAQSSTFA